MVLDMSQRQSHFVTLEGREIHISAWGNANKRPLIMWHGLARNGRDFDELAASLTAHYYVLCPDTLGRGLSEWAEDSRVEYGFEFYIKQVLALIQHFKIDKLDWVGTSMGGLLGMALAATALQGRIEKLVMNDIGPEIPKEAALRIAKYAGAPKAFATFLEFKQWICGIYQPFGENSEAFWDRLAETSYRRTDAGQFTTHYDPRIAVQLQENAGDFDAWPLYEQVKAKTLLVRGAASDVLLPGVAVRMQESGPRAELMLVENCGHAPTLAPEADRRRIHSFLLSD